MRFTVGRKIGLGFSVVGILILVVFLYTITTVSSANNTLTNAVKANKRYLELLEPSVKNLDRVSQDLTLINLNINKWVYDTSTEMKHMIELQKAIDSTLPADRDLLQNSVNDWNKDSLSDHELYNQINEEINQVLSVVDDVLINLSDFEAKTDDFSVLMAQNMVQDEINPMIDDIKMNLQKLYDKKNKEANTETTFLTNEFKNTSDSFDFLFKLIIIALIVLALGTIIIALFTTRSITGPVTQLKGILINLGKGIFPRQKVDPSNDEIGEMSIAMNQLVDGLKRTTDFANEVGKSNFDFPYTPLSNEDVLGHALVKMRDELAENERILEQKVKERTAEVVRQKEEIERQSEKLEELYKDVTDSIRYAKRLQDSILPQNSLIERLLPHSFVLFKPKDIVSGDFYWVSETENKILFSAVDCTGHGVPGAFMSLIGANALNQIINEKEDQPAKILDKLNKYSSEALNKSEEGIKVRDGMDLALCAVSKDMKILEFAGANNPLYIVRDGDIDVIKADKFAIASFEDGEEHYTNHNIELKKGDLVYVFSDGYADQFGGVKGKKFMYKQFRELLISIKDLSMDEQKEHLDQKIEEWKGSFEQVDDILVIGVRI
ncbi:MAG: SpoIIE family protein phosphatase [Flavobacteriales bacterium]|nr:SpoIIE family protein phosphatase [Flavobacteriales bacterium]MCB9196397.1 SpoIIE family protein phosphatase [Flavobacteriales bacterium]MCB9198435.1 SpoIIE family protein phosphatase [Flavobacteriales bacterium]